MDIQLQNDLLNDIIMILIACLVSTFFGIFLERFKNKLTVLTYLITYQPLATSNKDDWGDIKVFHNDKLIKHLSFVTININNETNKDLENVTVNISCDNNSIILGQSAFYDADRNEIKLENNYFNTFTDLLKKAKENEANFINNINHQTPEQLSKDILKIKTHKDFYVQVLNRHSSITINLLIENTTGQCPVVTPIIAHRSVKLVQREDAQSEGIKAMLKLVIWSLFIHISGCYILTIIFPFAKLPIIITGLLGVFYSLIGLGFFTFFRYIKKLFA